VAQEAPQDAPKAGGGGGAAAPAAPAGRTGSPVRGDGIADLVDQVKGAVVNIDTISDGTDTPGAEAFEDFFGGPPGVPRGHRPQRGVGSGFVLREDGLIVTNNHVVEGARRLTVTFADGTKHRGRVVGTDPLTDLALVRIDAKGLPTLALADPASLRVGQFVAAMGSPLGLQQTVTAGILSAINRDIALNARVGFLQTDAPINPGNSGGPLLNLRGEVIGVNAAIAATAQGIGFAIPVDTLRNVLPELERTGKVEHAWLGVGAVDLPEERAAQAGLTSGVVVGRVERGSPAARGGLREGDVIVGVNGQPVPDAAGLVRMIARLDVGARVTVDLVRAGRRQRVALVLEAMPPSVAER
jgi:serine protease Do